MEKEYIKSTIATLVRVASNEYKLTITRQEQLDLLEKVYSHYIDHSSNYSVLIGSLDPFKFLAWAGLILYHDIKKESEKKKLYLSSSIATMQYFLKKNDRLLSNDLLKKLYNMALNDNHIAYDRLAIGKNGLYLAFRTANEVEINPS